MPVAPATFLSLAIWVSFWMLRSFRSVILSVSGFAGAGFDVSAGLGSVARESTGLASTGFAASPAVSGAVVSADAVGAAAGAVSGAAGVVGSDAGAPLLAVRPG